MAHFWPDWHQVQQIVGPKVGVGVVVGVGVRVGVLGGVEAGFREYRCVENASYVLQKRRMRINSILCAGVFKKLNLPIF